MTAADPRPILHRYEDPADAIWIACAARLGYRIRRADDVYAGFDGVDTITVATGAELDPDDSLTQLIFHELCHALVADDVARHQPDWGLDNTSDRDLVDEHATHRLQAALADRFGLRGVMAATTQWRPHWDTLPRDPLGDGDDPAIPLARVAWSRARQSPWREALDDALRATAAVATAVHGAVQHDSLWSTAKPLHPLGVPAGDPSVQCSSCAWLHRAGPGPASDRCRQHRPRPGAPAPRVSAEWPSCERWEPALDDASCPSCGACCRQGYHLVPVAGRSALVRQHPELVVRDDHGHHLPRPDGFCVALERGHGDAPPYLCRVYDLRPSACRDFAAGGDHCLEARRRVGLSAGPRYGT